MVRREWRWVLAAACCGGVVLTSTANADRRTGLSGNQLIEDKDDVFKYPQLTIKHRNRIFFDYGGSADSGNAGFLFGDDGRALGLAIHRGDLLTPTVVGPGTELAWLSGVGNALTLDTSGLVAGTTPAFTAPATVVDLMGAKSLGGDRALGARLGLGHGQAFVVDDDGDRVSNRQTFVMGQAGLSKRPEEGNYWDLVGNVMVDFGKQKDENAAESKIARGALVRAGLAGRSFYPMNDLWELGALVDFDASYQRIKNLAFDPEDSALEFGFGLVAGMGPAIHTDRATLAGYATLGASMNNFRPTTDVDNNRVNTRSFVLPGIKMSVEVALTDWLYARTGADYAFSVVGQTSDPGSAAKLRTRDTAGNFNWNIGLGAATHGFTLDMVVQQGFVTNGPQFIGGNDPGFLAMASLGYAFGDVLSGPSTSTTSAPDSAAAPGEPAAEPEPAPAGEPGPAADETDDADATVDPELGEVGARRRVMTQTANG